MWGSLSYTIELSRNHVIKIFNLYDSTIFIFWLNNPQFRAKSNISNPTEVKISLSPLLNYHGVISTWEEIQLKQAKWKLSKYLPVWKCFNNHVYKEIFCWHNTTVGKVDIERWKDAYDWSCEKAESELTHVYKHVKWKIPCKENCDIRMWRGLGRWSLLSYSFTEMFLNVDVISHQWFLN